MIADSITQTSLRVVDQTYLKITEHTYQIYNNLGFY